MDGGAATTAVEVLVQNLINVSKEEISLIQGLEKDAGKLKLTLEMIQKFLNDAANKFITEEAVKTWLKELEAVAFDADNVLDELNYHALSKQMKTMMKTEKKKAPTCFPSINHYLRRRRMALTIKEINTTFESINKRATELGLERTLVNAHAVPDAGSETDSFTLDPIFTGRENDVSKLVEMLTNIPTEQVFSVLPIVGMGGLGKTTLTRNVFNHETIKTHFAKQIWVHVSPNFDPVSLLGKILTTLTSSGNDEVRSKEVILKRLQEALGAKTCLLVLDDVWNQDPQKWEGFINSLRGISSVKGNGIIVTTRNTEVASIVQTLPIYELKGLPEDSCWSIIKAKAFGERDIPSGFETVGRNIAERCHGLPLAANIVGGVLRGKSKDEWLSIKENWLSDVEGHENNISKILRLSLDNLSSPSLKKCFAYCSIFPKGAYLGRKELTELWVAEGFLQHVQRSEMETVGNKFFDILLQNSLFRVVSTDGYGNVMDCIMHDLVHDLACSVLGCPDVNDKISGSIYQTRYIGRIYGGGESSPITKEQAKYLRTLFYEGEISNITFSDFKCLHVLNLKGDLVEELPSSIKELIHLRYLDISSTRIRHLPDSIGELYLLQTLRAYCLWGRLPNTLKYLVSLRHLHVSDDIELPPELGMLASLQTLPCFKVGDEEGHRITELGSLKNLRGELRIHNLEKVHGEEEAEKAYLFRKPNIVRLVLRWSETREGEINDENVLAGLQPHPKLKMLEIFGFKGTRFPLWTSKMAVHLEGLWVGLDNLTEIRLSSCEECEEIPMLGHLPHLKSLYLSRLRNVRSIGSSFYSIDNCSSSNGVCGDAIVVFPALETFSQSDMPNLTEWVEVEFPSEVETRPHELKVFPCLKYLQITNCKQLRSAPSQFPCLKVLDISGMDSGLPLADICGIRLTSLTKLEIGEIDGLVCLPDWLFPNNQNLSSLRIHSLPNLRELPDDLHTLNSLEELRIVGCPKLKSIPYPSGGQSQRFTTLHRLYIRDCQGLTDLPCEMVESCVLSLESLSLIKLSSVTNLPMIINCLHKMSRLRDLTIVDVPKLIMTSSSTKIGACRSLQQLSIVPAAPVSCDCVVSFNKAVDGILQLGSQSLVYLHLTGMEHLDFLPDSLQHLTTLPWLELNNFGIEELPEWFGKLTSLQILKLRDCTKLRRLRPVLPKLNELSMNNCPALTERCIKQRNDADDDDSQWPKISHIPNIWVNGNPIQGNSRFGMSLDW